MKSSLTFSLFLGGSLLLGSSSHAAEKRTPKSFTVVVGAGPLTRSNTVASVELQGALTQARWLKSQDGKRTALQVDSSGRGWFLIPRLAAGATQSYELDLKRKPSSGRPECELEFSAGELQLSVRRHPAFTYHHEPAELPRPDIQPIYKRGGYIHPLFSPSGLQITDDYSTNHTHHHGIWSAWTKTVFEGRHPDFWNMGDGKGTVTPVALEESWDGPIHCGFRSRLRYYDLSTTPRRAALEETWEARLYGVGGRKAGYFLFDLDIRQTATASPLELLTYLYGGLGFRGNEEWNGASNTVFLTSEGITDRIKAHATHPRWCYIGGKVEGKQTGVAILCHGDSFRAPQPVRVHPSEPFFCYAPPQAGDFQITREKPYAAHYRFVTFDGQPNADRLNEIWEDYNRPVTTEIKLLY